MVTIHTENGKRLRINVLGDFNVSFKGSDANVDLKGAREILAYLSITQETQVLRERLTGILWPDMDNNRARTNFRQSLHHLKKKLNSVGYDHLEASRTTVGLTKNSFRTDIDILLHNISEDSNLPDVLFDFSPLGDAVLDKFTNTSDLFENWVVLRRRQIQQQVTSALNDRILTTPDINKKIAIARASLIQDPADERACRILMFSYAQIGKVAEALRIYRALWEHLSEEFDVSPTQKTQDLAVNIKLGEIAPEYVNAQESTTKESAPSVATLRPRVEIGEIDADTLTPELHSLVRAFRGEIMSRLSRFRECSFLDGTCLSDNSPRSDYQLFGVASFLANKLHISLRLLRTKSGELIWSESFADLSTMWPAILEEVAKRVSAETNIVLSRSRLTEITGRELYSLKGFDAWLSGQKLLFTFSKDNWEKATQLFIDILKKEQSFTRAYTSLAQLYNIRHLAFPGQKPDRSLFTDSLKLGNAAISIDPLDCHAHLCRGWSNVLLRDFTQGAVDFQTARTLNDHEPWIVLSSALGASFCGDIELAEFLADRSLKMGWTTEPHHWGYHATIRFLCNDFSGCINACVNANNVFFNTAAWHAAALVNLDRTFEASKIIDQAIKRCASHWSLNEEPSNYDVIDWVASGFPIKQVSATENFKKALYAAAQTSSNEM